jgi:hypothetical protein
MPFLPENANRNLTNTGALNKAHQLDFIGGDEGGNHRKLQFILTNPILIEAGCFFLRQRLVFY